MRNSWATTFLLLAALFLPALAPAQEPAEEGAREQPEAILRRLKGEFLEAEKLLHEAGSPAEVRAAQERVRSDLEKLLSGARGQQDAALKDLQKLIDFT